MQDNESFLVSASYLARLVMIVGGEIAGPAFSATAREVPPFVIASNEGHHSKSLISSFDDLRGGSSAIFRVMDQVPGRPA